MQEVRRGTHKLYKGQYFIVFYDKTDEELMYMFDNVADILVFMKKPLTKENKQVIMTELYRALKSVNHFTRFLTGEVLRVYLVKTNND